MIKVHVPRNFRITNPPSTVLISGMPLWRAWGAKFLTKRLALVAKTIWRRRVREDR